MSIATCSICFFRAMVDYLGIPNPYIYGRSSSPMIGLPKDVLNWGLVVSCPFRFFELLTSFVSSASSLPLSLWSSSFCLSESKEGLGWISISLWLGVLNYWYSPTVLYRDLIMTLVFGLPLAPTDPFVFDCWSLYSFLYSSLWTNLGFLLSEELLSVLFLLSKVLGFGVFNS